MGSENEITALRELLTKSNTEISLLREALILIDRQAALFLDNRNLTEAERVLAQLVREVAADTITIQ